MILLGKRFLLVLFSVLLLTSGACATKRETAGGPESSERVPDSWLFVLSADHAEVIFPGPDSVSITLTGTAGSAIAFTDRPNRKAATESLVEFASKWRQRFASSPPEAAIVGEDAAPHPLTGENPPVSEDDSSIRRDSLVMTIHRFEVSGDRVNIEAQPVKTTRPGSAIESFTDLSSGVRHDVLLRHVSLFVDNVEDGPSESNADGAPFEARPADLSSGSATPYIDAVVSRLKENNPTSEGIVWSKTSGNLTGSGDSSWILQTPECWGQDKCTSASFERFTQALKSMASSAEQVVDITTLYPFPDGEFRKAIANGLAETYKTGNRPLVRVTAGVPPTYSIGGDSPKEWRESLASDIASSSGVAPGDVRLVVTSVATSWGFSWNHAKIAAVDGREAIIGGHNYWTADYLQTTNPVSDVSLHHRGPVATEAHKFADNEWGFICQYKDNPIYVNYSAASSVPDCPATAPLSTNTPPGNVAMLVVGRLGIGIANPTVDSGPLPTDLASFSDARAIACSWVTDDYTNRGAPYERSNPGEPALRALIGSANKSITLTQQDLIGLCSAKIPPKWDIRVFDALAERIVNAGAEVKIVISTPGDWAYSNNGTLTDISSYLLSRVQRLKPGDAGRKLFCDKVAVAPIKVNSNDSWPGDKPFGNHTKVVAVDRTAFYVGSQNLYPAWLQEYGTIIDDAAAADTFYKELLDPMWEQSKRAADRSQCR